MQFDCDESIIGLVRHHDLEEVDDTVIMPDPAPVDFEDEDKADDAEAWKKSISLKFDRSDPEWWFSNIEAQMTAAGINLQWSKRNALLAKDTLPEDVLEELKPLFRLKKAEAGDKPYKDIKKELLSIYGKKDEQALNKAAARRLTSRPSALGKTLIHDICPDAKPFSKCHCARVVWWFFINQMPQVVKTSLADKEFNKDTYKAVFELADKVYASNRLGPDSPAVVATVSLDETQPAIPYAVDAVTFQSRGGGARRSRGQGARRIQPWWRSTVSSSTSIQAKLWGRIQAAATTEPSTKPVLHA